MERRVTRTILIAILIAAISLPGCTGTIPIPRQVSGSGKIVTKELGFSDFNRVQVGSVFEVEVIQSGSYGVAITANENLFEYIEVSQEGETLTIHLTPSYNYSNVTLKAQVALPGLSGLRLYGATRGTIGGFQSSSDFDLELSGASSVDMDMVTGDVRFEISGAATVTGDLKAYDAEFDVSAASRVKLRGSAGKMTLNASGASRLDLATFPLAEADVVLTGASEATVAVSGRLDVVLTGASTLYYRGDPMIGNIMVSDTSSIKRR